MKSLRRTQLILLFLKVPFLVPLFLIYVNDLYDHSMLFMLMILFSAGSLIGLLICVNNFTKDSACMCFQYTLFVQAFVISLQRA